MEHRLLSYLWDLYFPQPVPSVGSRDDKYWKHWGKWVGLLRKEERHGRIIFKAVVGAKRNLVCGDFFGSQPSFLRVSRNIVSFIER